MNEIENDFIPRLRTGLNESDITVLHFRIVEITGLR